MPKVSIIMPLYNKEAFLSNSIESVLRQSFSDFELIIVNDGSTDRSATIADYYSQNNSCIHVLTIPNGGVSNARNVGLCHARGKWIQFLDADDTIEADYLEKAFALLNDNSADILFSDFTMVDGNGTVVKEISSGRHEICNCKQLCDNYMVLQEQNGFFGFISNKLFRRETLIRSGAKFSTAIKLAEDLDFYAQLYPFISTACFSNIKSFRYLQTEQNYIYDDNIDYMSQIQVQMEIREWFIKVGMHERYRKRLNKNVAEYVFLTLFHAYERKQKCTDEFRYLIQNKEVCSCIDLRQHVGFNKAVLFCVKRQQEWFAKGLLWTRWSIRKIYRRFR